MTNINVFKQYPDCISNRTKLRGILSDFFPTEKVKVNLILNAYDEGIIDGIKRSNNLGLIQFNRWKKIVIDNYGISEDNAKWVIDYWFSEYGVAVCGKLYEKPEQQKEPVKKKSVPMPIQQKVPTTADGFVDISQLNAGEKIPKSMVEIITDSCPVANITSFTCSVRRDYQYDGITSLKFTGEYTGSCSQYVLVMMMVYNANNELIGYEDSKKIEKDFSGKGSFSETVRVPTDEYISKAVVRLTVDPTFV